MTATEDRWTVDDNGWLRVPSGRRKAQIEGDHADLFRSALANEYARRALPDGVELHRDGSLWALGRDIPDGWDRRIVDGEWFGPRAACAEAWYEVRPPQTPPTVRVDAYLALRDERVVAEDWNDGSPFTAASLSWEEDPDGRRHLCILGDDRVIGQTVAADGTVEVLA